ncbi:hypothetical protein HDV05_000726, partial [Chytridiales sp. JEL 0842]
MSNEYHRNYAESSEAVIEAKRKRLAESRTKFKRLTEALVDLEKQLAEVRLQVAEDETNLQCYIFKMAFLRTSGTEEWLPATIPS